MQKKLRLKLKVALMILAAISLLIPCAYAQTHSTSQQVSIIIPYVLNLQSEVDHFTLNFNHYKSGSETDTKTVNYSIEANSVERNAGVVQGKLNVQIPNVQVNAQLAAYNKAGGNAALVRSGSGFTPLSTTFTPIADRQIQEGSGMVMRGNFSIAYKAIALDDLEHSTVTPCVTITVFDN